MHGQVFIVFHKSFSRQLTNTEGAEHVSYFAVSAEHSKAVLVHPETREFCEIVDMDDVTYEYGLKWYDPSYMYQANGYMETSAYIHIMQNQVSYASFIGVTQYDMIWSEEAHAQVKSMKQPSDVLCLAFDESFGRVAALPLLTVVKQHDHDALHSVVGRVCLRTCVNSIALYYM